MCNKIPKQNPQVCAGAAALLFICQTISTFGPIACAGNEVISICINWFTANEKGYGPWLAARWFLFFGFLASLVCLVLSARTAWFADKFNVPAQLKAWHFAGFTEGFLLLTFITIVASQLIDLKVGLSLVFLSITLFIVGPVVTFVLKNSDDAGGEKDDFSGAATGAV